MVKTSREEGAKSSAALLGSLAASYIVEQEAKSESQSEELSLILVLTAAVRMLLKTVPSQG